jgi:hypothetical protein
MSIRAIVFATFVAASSLAGGCATHHPPAPSVVVPPTAQGPHTGAASLYPDPNRTSGVVNPNVTQQNLASTICQPGWTATIRPASSFTTKLKKRQMTEWHLVGGTKDYEEDQQAQNLIRTDWYAEYQKIGAPAGPLDSDDEK